MDRRTNKIKRSALRLGMERRTVLHPPGGKVGTIRAGVRDEVEGD
jgi:hypothetical protein